MEQRTATPATEQINRNLGAKAYRELVRMLTEKNGDADKKNPARHHAAEPAGQQTSRSR